MNAVHNARDLLNQHDATSKRSNATSWLGALNAATGTASSSAAFNLNDARSQASDAANESFRTAMDKLTARSTKSTAPPTAEDVKLRKTAETLVNKMFVGTMLKSMRSGPFKDSAMSGGKAGDAYAGMFDQNLAEHAGGGIGTKLVDTLVKQFKKTRGDPNQLHVDPSRDLKKPAATPAAATAAAHALITPSTPPTKKAAATRADHDASTVNLAA